jgi:hypothetical protein
MISVCAVGMRAAPCSSDPHGVGSKRHGDRRNRAGLSYDFEVTGRAMTDSASWGRGARAVIDSERRLSALTPRLEACFA